VTMQTTVIWVVTSCSSERDGRFGRTHGRTRRWKRYIPLKRWAISELQGLTTWNILHNDRCENLKPKILLFKHKEWLVKLKFNIF
jgi:hypothetical protein